MSKQLNQTAKRLHDLVKAVKDHGGMKEVEKRFSIDFYDLKHSVRGPSYDLTMKILSYLEYPPEAFLEPSMLLHKEADETLPEPTWWNEFEALRLDDPYKALEALPEECGSGWRSLAIGMVADQWAKKQLAIHHISKSPDLYRLHRNLAPVYRDTSLPMALFHSDRAASLAAYSGRGTMPPLVVERAGILVGAGEYSAARAQLEKATTDGLKPLELGGYWQLKAGLQIEFQEDPTRALENAEEIASANLSRNFSGHVFWVCAKHRGSTSSYWKAVEAFGIGFPRKAALVALELHSFDPGAGALGLAAELFRANGFFQLACIVEDEIARTRFGEASVAAKAIERWARARSDSALRQKIS